MQHDSPLLTVAWSPQQVSAASSTGNGLSFMVGRVSYSLGLVGPCVGLDTACSSSLVTTHLAHRALLDGEATAAVTAGVNVMFSPLITAAICQLQVRGSAAMRGVWLSQGELWPFMRLQAELMADTRFACTARTEFQAGSGCVIQ